MKVAFHFDVDHADIANHCSYFIEIAKIIFKVILNNHSINLITKVLCGDFDLRHLALHEVEQAGPDNPRVFRIQYDQIIDEWLFFENSTFSSFTEECLLKIYTNNVHVFCFENIEFSDAFLIDRALWKFPFYAGALKVNNNNSVHHQVYDKYLLSMFQINKDEIRVCDPFFTDEIDEYLVESLREVGFAKVDAEIFGGLLPTSTQGTVPLSETV
jgi:hypothetical protein